MPTFYLIPVTFALCILLGWGAGHAILVTTRCEFHNETLCAESQGGSGCNETQDCDPPETEKRTHCYVLWQNDSSGRPAIKLKGCFLNNVDCFDQQRCVEKRGEHKKGLLFCCCEGDMCNRDFTWEPQPSTAPTVDTGVVQVRPNNVYSTIVYTLLPVVALGIAIVIFYWFYHQRKMSYFNEVPTMDPHPLPPPSPTLGTRPIQLIEIKARGRFGAVWKAQYKTELVAVKILSIQDSHDIPRLDEVELRIIMRVLESA